MSEKEFVERCRELLSEENIEKRVESGGTGVWLFIVQDIMRDLKKVEEVSL